MFLRSRVPLALLLILALGACSSKEDGPGPGQREHGGPGQRGDQPPVPVAVEPAITGAISSTYAANATLEPFAQAEILSRVPGVVQSLEVEEGDEVRKGQILLHIEADEYRLRLQQAEAKTRNLRSQFDRLSNMKERGLISAEEFDTAEANLADAEAAEGLARLELGYTAVRAPIEGRLVERMVDPGQSLSTNVALFRLADFTPLLARVHVPSKEFRRLTTEQPVTLRLDSDGTVLSGHIQLVSPVIDPNTGTIKVTVEIPEYPKGVRPGDFAEVRIVTERREKRTLIPRIALVSDKGEDVVYVEQGGRAERRPVELGLSDADHAEILSGVQPGEVVIVKGQRSLQNGQAVRVLEGEASTGTVAARPDSTQASRDARKHPRKGRRRAGGKAS